MPNPPLAFLVELVRDSGRRSVTGLNAYLFQEGVGNDGAGNESIRIDEDSTAIIKDGCAKCDLLGSECRLPYIPCPKNGRDGNDEASAKGLYHQSATSLMLWGHIILTRQMTTMTVALLEGSLPSGVMFLSRY